HAVGEIAERSREQLFQHADPHHDRHQRHRLQGENCRMAQQAPRPDDLPEVVGEDAPDEGGKQEEPRRQQMGGVGAHRVAVTGSTKDSASRACISCRPASANRVPAVHPQPDRAPTRAVSSRFGGGRSVSTAPRPEAQDFDRETKRASRVSTTISSSLSRYDGTWITRPVSRVAGFVCACAVAPFKGGAVSTTRSTTVCGRSTEITLPLKTTERIPSRPSVR